MSTRDTHKQKRTNKNWKSQPRNPDSTPPEMQTSLDNVIELSVSGDLQWGH